MPVRFKRKVTKQRGSRTHGWGAGKKHRGAGNRGGRGRAGVGKRASQKKTWWLQHGGKSPLGKHGMQITRWPVRIKGINLEQINSSLDEWVADKKATKEKDGYVLNLKSIGYDKVLSMGEIKSKVKITARAFSKKAEEKIKKAGGEAVVA